MASLPFLGELRLEDIAPKGDDHQDVPDPTAAPPGYNEERALADDRNRELKNLRVVEGGQNGEGDLKRIGRFRPSCVEGKWYSKDTILEHRTLPPQSYVFGYFDWDKTFFWTEARRRARGVFKRQPSYRTTRTRGWKRSCTRPRPCWRHRTACRLRCTRSCFAKALDHRRVQLVSADAEESESVATDAHTVQGERSARLCHLHRAAGIAQPAVLWRYA